MNLSNGYKLYDRLISLTLYRITDNGKGPTVGTRRQIKAIEIPFSYRGYKPSIEISVSMLPDDICFEIVVRVTNAALVKNTDIRTFAYMEIVAGYPGNVQGFAGPVFSSYIEKPNPDGVVVFEGIVTGKVGLDLFRPKPYRVYFNSSDITVQELCASVARGLGVKLDMQVHDTIKHHIITSVDSEKLAANGYAVINWLQTFLQSWVRAQWIHKAESWQYIFGQPFNIYTWLKDDTLIVTQTNRPITQDEKERCVVLTAVKNMSYSGPALTAVAPYDPKVKPGQLIYANPMYYSAGKTLLNIMPESIYNPDDGYYRVLKMDVKFATTGSVNEMNILALPCSQYTQGNDEGDRTLQESVQQVQDAYNQLKREKEFRGIAAKSVDSSEGVIVIGFKDSLPPKEDDIPPKDMWSINYNMGYTTHTVKPNENLEGIAKAYYGKEKFYLPDSQLSSPFNRAFPDGVPLYYFFPLIMFQTYKAMKASTGDIKYTIDTNNPEFVKEGWNIAIPGITIESVKSFIGVQPVIKIFQYIAEFYKKRGQSNYADAFTDIYMYLSRGTV